MSGRARAVCGAAAGAAALAGTALAAGVTAVSGSAPSGGAAPGEAVARGFTLDGSVTPRRAYFAGRRAISVRFAIVAAGPLDLRLDVVREATRKPVRRLALGAVAPGTRHVVEWDGLTAGGKVAPNGRYRMRLVAPDGSARNAGRVDQRSHIYPIRGRHVDRGAAGQFGVGRNGGRTHEGFDVDAACGTPVVAARGGVVRRAAHDPVLYGNIVVVRGERTRRDYWYSHLLRRPRLRVGDRVRTGQRIGSVGATGNARTIGCHLHFEIRSRGRPIDPAPELHAWDRWS
ncbi:MAG: M23 family metallopeptidase [Thermoleophilia bacterium]